MKSKITKEDFKNAGKTLIKGIASTIIKMIVGVACLYFGYNVLLPFALSNTSVTLAHLSLGKIIVLYYAMQFISVPIAFYVDDVFKNTMSTVIKEKLGL